MRLTWRNRCLRRQQFTQEEFKQQSRRGIAPFQGIIYELEADEPLPQPGSRLLADSAQKDIQPVGRQAQLPEQGFTGY